MQKSAFLFQLQSRCHSQPRQLALPPSAMPDSTKRKAPTAAAGSSKKKQASEEHDPYSTAPSAPTSSSGVPLVHPKRVQVLKAGPPSSGPVIYWMSRDQRMADNWALIHAAEVAAKSGAPVAVAFNLVGCVDRRTAACSL